jgi:peptidoglycan/xylan/chitin deacetylase (PgdA/CDA1 family)
VLALTWDDGPDTQTLALAKYLAARHVSATFFVVREWTLLSEEPGRGQHRFETGYARLPVLGDLVALDHRLGNHTTNHALLLPSTPSLLARELDDNQKGIDPFLTNELRLFRAPGGAWDESAGALVDDDAALAGIVGPFRWDIDGKDWEGSLYCRSERPSTECEPAPPGDESRVRAEVIAARYLDAIATTGHGIVLFHDRVGDVGSDYARKVAALVVPELEARGYVFTAPTLELSPFRARLADDRTREWARSLEPESVRFVDADGDGRADLCGAAREESARVTCARSIRRSRSDGDLRPETVFEWSPTFQGSPRSAPPRGEARLTGDLNGDGREDTCVVTPDGVACALQGPHGPLGASTWLSRSRPDASRWISGVLALADVNGDGRADLCSLAHGDIGCAFAP